MLEIQPETGLDGRSNNIGGKTDLQVTCIAITVKAMQVANSPGNRA